MSVIVKEAGKAIQRADERAPITSLAKSNLRKIFPDHWSFMLGEIALYSFSTASRCRRPTPPRSPSASTSGAGC